MVKDNQGYTKISNDLLDNLCMIRISGQARQVLDVIFRKTYGFNKDTDRIALSQFSNLTGLKKQTVCKVINILKRLNLIIVTQKGNILKDNTYEINDDCKTWKPLPKKVTINIVPKKVIIVTKKDNTSLPKMVHTKDNDTKDNIQKAGHVKKRVAKLKVKLAGPESEQARLITEMIEAFKITNPAMKYGDTTQREACVSLISHYSFERVMIIIKQTLPLTNKKAFFPTITTPYQLFQKWAQLESKIQQYRDEQINKNKPKGNETLI